MGSKPELKILDPLRAIRAHCRECSGGNVGEIRRCRVYDCALWPHRMGMRGNTLAKHRPELLDPSHVHELGQQKYRSECN